MLEMLLLLTALNGNQESFNKSTEAYYRYQKLDVIVDNYAKKHQVLANTVALAGLVKEKKIYYQIAGPIYQESKVDESTNDFRNIIWYKKDF